MLHNTLHRPQYTVLRNGIYHLRVRVPAACRGITTRRELTFSLKTDSYREACRIVSSKLHTILRIKNMSPQSSLPELQALYNELTDFSRIDARGAWPATHPEVDGASTLANEARESLSEGGGKMDFGGWTTAQPIPATTNADRNRAFEWLFLFLMEARAERMVNGRSDEFFTWMDKAGRVMEGTQEAPLLLSKAWADFKASRSWTDKKARENNRFFEFMFVKWGDIDVKLVTKQMVRNLLNDFSQMPVAIRAPYKSMSIAELAALEVDEEQYVSGKTVKGLLEIVQGLFSSYLTGEMDVLPKSPTEGVTWKYETVTYGHYSDSEIQAFEQAAIAETVPWKKWGLLVGIYSGMRMSEVSAVLAAGVNSADGVHYFDILNGKTEAAKRKVPVHSRLIELGLLEAGLIIVPTITSLTGYTKALRDSLGIPEKDGDGLRRVYHSLRHTFITKAIYGGNEQAIVQALVGHAKKAGITDRYIHNAPLSTLKAVVESVKFGRGQ